MDPRFENLQLICFDAGSTLFDEMALYEDRAQRTIDLNHLSLTLKDFMDLLYEGAYLRKNPYQYACKQLGNPTQVDWDFSLETLMPGALEVLAALKGHYKLAIVANQPPHFLERVEKLGITSYFAGIYGSSDLHLYKPDPAFFRYALQDLGVRPEEALMIGDRLENDIFPAQKVGMRTIRFISGVSAREVLVSPSEHVDATISSLGEILPFLL